MCSVPVTLGGGSWMQNGLRVRVHRRLELAARFPQRVPLRLDGAGLEAFREFHGGRRTPRARGKLI